MQRVRRPTTKAKAIRSGGKATGQEKTGSNRNVALRTSDGGGQRPSRTADWRVKRQSRIRKEPAMEGTTFVGLDAHKEWINVAMLQPGRETPIEWQGPNEAGAIKKMLRRIEGEAAGEVRFCYEAGPCGYALQRQITDWSEASCMVVAPSLIPGKPGERVKTDRRDAKKLAFLFRAGMLTEVQPPSEEDEAARDLCRVREDAREDLIRCRHRLTSSFCGGASSSQGESGRGRGRIVIGYARFAWSRIGTRSSSPTTCLPSSTSRGASTPWRTASSSCLSRRVTRSA
jgi:hypothetical protein